MPPLGHRKSLDFREGKHYVVDANGCWLWTGRKDRKGYGMIWRADQQGIRHGLLVHRVAFEQHVGPIPNGHDIHHTCEVHECINPAHLCALTHEAHARIPDRANKLNWKKAREIRAFSFEGMSNRAIAKRFGVNESIVSRVVHHKIWRSEVDLVRFPSRGHGRAKLGPDQIAEAQTMKANGITQAVIADALGVTQATISNLFCGKIRSYQPQPELR